MDNPDTPPKSSMWKKLYLQSSRRIQIILDIYMYIQNDVYLFISQQSRFSLIYCGMYRYITTGNILNVILHSNFM